MVELTKFFIRETDTKTLVEVSFYDSKYISTEQVSKWKVIKKNLLVIFSVLFRVNKVNSNETYPYVKQHADRIFTDYNKYKTDNDEEPIDYTEFFGKTNIKPNYIG